MSFFYNILLFFVIDSEKCKCYNKYVKCRGGICFMMTKTKEMRKKWSKKHYELLVMAMIGVVFLVVFSYFPMAGVLLAFKNGNKSINLFNALLSPGFTLDNFKYILTSAKFWSVFTNTLGLNLLMLLFGFPTPIIFALLINEVKNRYLRGFVQTVANFPHFISWVIYGGIILSMTSMSTGIVNPVLHALGILGKEDYISLNSSSYFWGEMIVASLIKNVGWGSIVYTAAIAGIGQDVYEAAEIDGANRFQQAMRITLPLISSTITVFLLLNISRLLRNSFEQFYIFQNGENLSKSEVLATYSYTMGFTYRNYSYAAAMGLFDSFISLLMLLASNFISKKITGRGIF